MRCSSNTYVLYVLLVPNCGISIAELRTVQYHVPAHALYLVLWVVAEGEIKSSRAVGIKVLRFIHSGHMNVRTYERTQ